LITTKLHFIEAKDTLKATRKQYLNYATSKQRASKRTRYSENVKTILSRKNHSKTSIVYAVKALGFFRFFRINQR